MSDLRPGWVFLPPLDHAVNTGGYIWAPAALTVLKIPGGTRVLMGKGEYLNTALTAEEVLDLIDTATDARDRQDRRDQQDHE